MSLIYIAGSSGAGKSSVRQELIKRGYKAHDTDEDGMSHWYENVTGKPVERPHENDRSPDWFEKHEFRMSHKRLEALAERAKEKTIFLCGLPANDLEFIDHYDKVIFLEIDKETIKDRIAKRTSNEFGQSPDELELILFWHDKILKRYKDLKATMIDATQPLDKVVNQILTLSLKSFDLASPGPLRDQLVKAVLEGKKTATSSLLKEWRDEQESFPAIGERQLLVNSDSKPVAIVEITGISQLRVGDVDLSIAIDEGEDFTTVEDWRKAHEEFWNYADVDDDTMIVVERFKLVERV